VPHFSPFSAGGFAQAPDAGSHVPATWHSSSAAQTVAVPPAQTPPRHVSPVVQASPSSQAVPSVWSGLEQSPVAGSHVPAAWHGSAAAQRTGLPPVQTPLAAHWNPPKQRSG